MIGMISFQLVLPVTGFVNTLMSWSAWAPLSRLTYGVYLVHLIIIYVLAGNVKKPLYQDSWTLVWIKLYRKCYMGVWLGVWLRPKCMKRLEQVVFSPWWYYYYYYYYCCCCCCWLLLLLLLLLPSTRTAGHWYESSVIKSIIWVVWMLSTCMIRLEQVVYSPWYCYYYYYCWCCCCCCCCCCCYYYYYYYYWQKIAKTISGN